MKEEKKQIRVAVLGTIGCGKTTFIKNLGIAIRDISPDHWPIIKGEPTIVKQHIKDMLENLYQDMESWIFPMQLSACASYEEDIVYASKSAAKIALFDAPMASSIFCRIHHDGGRLSKEDLERIELCNRHTKFDYAILLESDYETTVSHVRRRNADIHSEDNNSDVPVEDFSYLKEHIEGFNKHLESWLEKYFYDSEIIRIKVPELDSEEYNIKIKNIANKILSNIEI